MFRLLKIISIAAVLFSPFVATGANAGTDRIECPVNQVRTEITTPLPSGWWQTPQVGNLQDTRITEMGGDTVLMCGYWAYGETVYIMKKAPTDTNCTADATGFNCTGLIVIPPIVPGIIVPAPVTYKTGPISLKQTWSMDLDNGTTGGSGGDIRFEAITATERYLTPINGASMAIAGNTSINLAGCKSLAGYTTSRLPVDLFRTGLYVCVKTDEGRYSQFRVNAAAGPSPATMEIGFTTWAN